MTLLGMAEVVTPAGSAVILTAPVVWAISTARLDLTASPRANQQADRIAASSDRV